MILRRGAYEVQKRPSADEIAPATKKTIYTLKLRKEKAGEESSNDNSSEAEYDYTVYKIILYTPSISLTLHAPNTHGKACNKIERPTSEKDDELEGFDTAYLGTMIRNADNDQNLLDNELLIIRPMDNSSKSVWPIDDDFVALNMELKQPEGIPSELSELILVNLVFKDSTNKQIRVYDEDQAIVNLNELSAPKSLIEEGDDKHLSKLINKGMATIYLEGLGHSGSEKDSRWGDEIDQVSLRLTTGAVYDEAEEHGLLLMVEFRDYFGGDLSSEKKAPKCCAQKVKQNMLTHSYPDGDRYSGSERCIYFSNQDTLDISVRLPVIDKLKYELVYEYFGEEKERKEVFGSDDIQVIKYNINNLDSLVKFRAIIGSRMKVHLLVTRDDKEIFKSFELSFLLDEAKARNQLFKSKIDPYDANWKGKGSTSEMLMGFMLHEVSREIVSLVEKNTFDHTKDSKFHLNDPRATQGTNRVIIGELYDQIGKVGSEWDKAADHALAVEIKAYDDVLSLNEDGQFKLPHRILIDAIFHNAFNEFEKIENKFRGEGWGRYGCPCGGDNQVLTQASLRGVKSPEVLKAAFQNSPAASVFATLPLSQSVIAGVMNSIQNEKSADLKNNFLFSWALGGCCN